MRIKWWNVLYLRYVRGLRVGRGLAVLFVGGTRIMIRRKRGQNEKKI